MPVGKTEKEVLDTIEKVVRRLSTKFVFGFYTVQDVRQEARLMALRGLKDYDGVRPLENFLFTHVKNRLINFKRDNYRRSQCPCHICGEAYKEGKGGPHKNESGEATYCDVFHRWNKRNISKQHIVEPLDIDYINDERESHMRVSSQVVEDCIVAEALEKIDKELPTEYRAAYLQLREGLIIPKLRRTEVQREIRRILHLDDGIKL